jgi:hypothetical protein
VLRRDTLHDPHRQDGHVAVERQDFSSLEIKEATVHGTSGIADGFLRAIGKVLWQ